MALYFEDWSNSTVDAFPVGWTRRFAELTDNQWNVREVGGVRYLEMGSAALGSYGRQLISLDAVDSDATRNDVEVVFKWQCASVGTSRPQLKGAGRCSGDATNTNAYLGGFDNSGGGHRVQKYVAGTSSTINSAADTVLANTDYITRFRINGDWVTVKTWLASEQEPGTADAGAQDTSLTGTGWVGLFTFNSFYVYKISFVGIGTGGDIAPTSIPVADTTAPTLTNPQFATINPTTVECGVDTDEANGNLYYISTVNSTENGTIVKSGSSASVIQVGTQSVLIEGLSPNTTYYTHFLHRDAAGNDSGVVSTAAFTTELAEPTSDLTLVSVGDSFNAHPTNSGIVDAGTTTPTVNISVRVIYSVWRQFYFKLENALNKRPIFKIDPTGFVSVFTASWRPWFSYDGITWNRFDTAPANGTTWDFQHSTAFTNDAVYVAYQPAWPVSRVPWLINELQTINSSLIHELPSSPSFEYITPLTPQIDELGNTVPSQKMYALGIWDNTLNPLDGSAKRIAIITGGVHAGEHIGSWPMEGFLRYLVSGTEQAITLLCNFKFHIYPMLNPMGRYMGHYRGQRDPARLTLDPNRDYPANGSSSLLQSSNFFRSMLAEDIGSNLAAFSLDFHSTLGNSGSFYFYTDPSFDPYAVYTDEWHVRIQAYSTGYTRQSSTLDTTVDQHLTRTYKQKHSYVPEVYESSSFSGNTADVLRIGEDYAKALAGSPLSEMRTPQEVYLAVPSAVTASPTSISPVVSQKHNFSVSGGMLGSPGASSLTLEQHALFFVADEMVNVGFCNDVNIRQEHALVPVSDIVGAPFSSEVVLLGTAHHFTIESFYVGGPVYSTPVIDQNHVLSIPNFLISSPVPDYPQLSQEHNLSIQNFYTCAPFSTSLYLYSSDYYLKTRAEFKSVGTCHVINTSYGTFTVQLISKADLEIN